MTVVGRHQNHSCRRARPDDLLLKEALHQLTRLALAFCFSGSPIDAQSLLPDKPTSSLLIGHARAADGDSLVLDGKRIRLFGIDAPELRQVCKNVGRSWACGEVAKEKLEALVSAGEVICKTQSIDAFRRNVATCVIGTRDVNEAMVRSGYATAYRHYSAAYVRAEEQARAGRVGIWAGQFELPSNYRHEGEGAAAAPRVARPPSKRIFGASSPAGCLIKGNHSRRGKWIYHMPGMPYYAGTRAEVMFCTEAEAQAAGYRRSRVR